MDYHIPMSVNDDKPTPGWMWPRSLGEEVAEELLSNGLLVPPGCRLLAGWDISLDGRVVCPLPTIDSDEMLYLVLKRRSQLPDTLKSNAVFGHGNPCWPAILETERGKQIEHDDVDVPAHDERWRLWKG